MTNFTGLPTRQLQCLHTVIRLIDEAHQSPTIEEIATAMEITKPAAHQLVDGLVAKGRLNRDPRKHRSITVIEEKKALKI